MSSELIASGVLARVYAVGGTGPVISLQLADVVLDDIEAQGGELVGQEVIVGSRCVLVDAGPGGELRGVPMEPLRFAEGTAIFDPAAGGVRTRFNRQSAGAYNEEIAQATRFGMINAFYHVGLAAKRINELLRELGAGPLPAVKVVVAAHAGSRLPGFAAGDGDYRRGHMLPFSGGHYRLSAITSGVPELFPVSPTGEIHLGPGRRRQRFAGLASYLANAAHNPATIYHEYGHHIARHTADFRMNAERDPAAQRNGKIAIEEGVCDYFAASILGTGRPYGWFRPVLGERRDPGADRALESVPGEDAHGAGALWAAALWGSREGLLEEGLLDSSAHDRVVLAALLEAGSSGARATDPRRRRTRQAERCAPRTMISAYLAALRAAGGRRAFSIGEEFFHRVGFLPREEIDDEVSRC